MAAILDAPCMGCKERYFKCHADCERYIEFRKFKDEFNDSRRKNQEMTHSILMIQETPRRINKNGYVLHRSLSQRWGDRL